MEKLTFYRYTTWGLLAMNFILLALHVFPVFGPPGGPGRGMNRALHNLQLDEQQHERFQASAQTHQADMQRINEAQRELLSAYFAPLTTDYPSPSGTVPPEYAALNAEKVAATFQHFLDVKAILKPEQQQLYQGWVDTAIKRLLVTKNEQPPR